jgi:hypothetical protein
VFENILLERKLIYLVANYFGSSFNEPSTVKDKEDNKAFFGKVIKRVWKNRM